MLTFQSTRVPVVVHSPQPTQDHPQEFPSGLGLCAMGLAIQRPLTVPGTLAWPTWEAALTVPGAPVAWLQWGTRVGTISHLLTALERTLPGS